MEASTVKNKVTIIGNDKAEICMNGVQFKELRSFKYVGANLSRDGSSMSDIRIRITTLAKARLDRI